MFFVFFFLIFFFFFSHTLEKLQYLACTLADFLQIRRAVRTYYIKAHLQSNFCRDWMKNRRVMGDFQISKFDFWGCLQGKPLKESLENWSKDGVINIVQTFCGLKEIRIMVMEL